MKQKQQPSAFISHTEADYRFVRPFASALRGRCGVEARVYKWEKKAGREKYIEMAQEADVFVPILSDASVSARGVLDEINAVTDKIVNTPDRVIPVILGKLPREKFPPALRNLEYVREDDGVKAAEEVARLIRGEAHPDKPPVKDGRGETLISEELARVALPAFKLGVLLQMAESGDTNAQNALGVMYAEGEGIPQNSGEAAKWFRRAAGLGDAWAQFNLGVMCHDGKGVSQDDVEAAKWWRCAAEQGLAEAQFNLGVMYQEGRGVAQDDVEAVKWWHRAAKQEHAEAQCNLGGMYREGKGVSQDDVEAAKWCRRAAEQGDAHAQCNLGVVYHEGRGVAQDDVEAVRWWRRAAEREHAQAQFNLGVMYREGKGVPQDSVEAAKWFRRAADQGFPPAKDALE